ncbi:MAG: hypothetical protein QFX40_06205 [Archaeoglobales archaeon]|nr:hypothetical protein [Archaeoglobales archaeon]
MRIKIAKFKIVAKRIQKRYGIIRNVATLECFKMRTKVMTTAISRSKMSMKPSRGLCRLKKSGDQRKLRVSCRKKKNLSFELFQKLFCQQTYKAKPIRK